MIKTLIKYYAEFDSMSVGKLAIELSKLESFSVPDIKEEQYITDSQIAAHWLNNADILDDIEGKIVMDLGAGTGILSIGAALLGAKRVILVEKDKSALEAAKKNISLYEDLPVELSHGNIEDDKFCEGLKKKEVDVIIQNPPFGTKQKHADRLFLEKAFGLGKVVYSMHKTTSQDFLEAFAKDNGFRITHRWDYYFPIKNVYNYHKKRIQRIKVGVWRFEKA